MATRFKLSEMPMEHYENQPIKAQRFLKQDDNQETYEEVDDGNYGNDSQTSEEEGSQETYEEIDKAELENAYTVLVKGTRSYTTTSAVQKTSSKQTESTIADTIALVLPQRDSSSRKWKIVSIVSFIIIITLICALITVSIMLTTSKDNVCAGSPCLNKGTCFVVGDRYKCSCEVGYHGDRCEYDLCEDSPCLNNGTCSFFVDRYDCSCEVGYHGDNCENDYCTSSPCLHNGTCSSHSNRYICFCETGYYGEICENEGWYVQTIESPGYPSDYPHHLSKVWKIDVGSGYKAVLIFQNFSTEYGYDYVTVYNSASTGSQILCKWFGQVIPTELVTTGQHVTVQMTTDEFVSGTGFSAFVYKIKK